jgi:hypothetical protein
LQAIPRARKFAKAARRGAILSRSYRANYKLDRKRDSGFAAAGLRVYFAVFAENRRRGGKAASMTPESYCDAFDRPAI